MARKKNDNRFKPWEGSNTKDRHIRLTDSMMKSKAWNDLSLAAKVLYIEFKRKYDGNNADDISMTYAEGVELMHQQTYQKAMQGLIRNGFIVIVSEGYFARKCNTYAFSSEWRVYPNNEYKMPHYKIPTKAAAVVPTEAATEGIEASSDL